MSFLQSPLLADPENRQTGSSSYLENYSHLAPDERLRVLYERTQARMEQFQQRMNKKGKCAAGARYINAWIMIHRLKLQLGFFLICSVACIYALRKNALAQLKHDGIP